MSDTATETKTKAGKIGTDEDAILARFIIEGMSPEERRAAVIETQMRRVASTAFASIADVYHKLTGKTLGSAIALDSDGFFADEDGNGNAETENDDENDDETETDDDDDDDDDAIDATAGEDEDETEDETEMTPGQAVRALRKYMKAKGLNQTAVANKLGITPPAVNHWLQGHGKPREKMARKIQRLVTK